MDSCVAFVVYRKGAFSTCTNPHPAQQSRAHAHTIFVENARENA